MKYFAVSTNRETKARKTEAFLCDFLDQSFQLKVNLGRTDIYGKGFNILLEAYRVLHNAFPDVRLGRSTLSKALLQSLFKVDYRINQINP